MPRGDSSPASPRTARVLVWGACGFLGRYLVTRLLAEQARVTVLTRPRGRYSPAPWSAQVRWVETHGARPDRALLREAAAKADVVYHFAGSTGAADSNLEPLKSLDENNRIHLEFLEACREARARPRVVFTSSRLVYGPHPRLPVAEGHPANPGSVYAAHKLCCEQYLRIYAARGLLSYVIARISNVFGDDPDAARKPHGIINAFVEQGLRGEPLRLFGDGSQLRDYLYIDDAIDALLRCGFDPAATGQTFNVGAGRGISLWEAARAIQARTGASAILHTPWPAGHRQVETGHFIADIGKIRRELGFRPRYTFTAGLEAMLAARRRRARSANAVTAAI